MKAEILLVLDLAGIRVGSHDLPTQLFFIIASGYEEGVALCLAMLGPNWNQVLWVT